MPFKWVSERVRHKLFGDGVTDDTEAFQAWLDGDEVIDWNGDEFTGVSPVGATYRITKTLEINRPRHIYGGTLVADMTDEDAPILRINTTKENT